MEISKAIHSDQRRMRMMSVKVDGTGTAALSGTSKNSMTLTDNGTGDYTLTFDVAFRRAPEVLVTSNTDGIVPRIGTCTTSAVQILTDNDAGSATDADFHVLIIGSDDPDFI